MATRSGPQDGLREQIACWNRVHPIGTAVRCAVYPDRVHRTRSAATLLFARKAVIHLEGFSGYFDLDQVQPAAEPPAAVARRTAILFPGQGSQSRGMGRELFAAFPEQTHLASEILGYSIERLCLEDPDGRLDDTRYTQPALYVVNALGYRRQVDANPACRPAFLLGHSLGEYNALLAAGVFDFTTGLQLVMKRGELMGMARGGSMAAIRGVSADRVRDILSRDRFDDVDLASDNTPTQTVIAGPAAAVERVVAALAAQRIDAVRLRVSGAFHSRCMQDARLAFAEHARTFTFAPPAIPVIANATGRPYEASGIVETLCAQMTSPVRWTDSVRYVLVQGDVELVEIGGSFLSGMVKEISGRTG